MELHEGTVVAQSAGEGQGSTFTITLPIYSVDVNAQVQVSRSGQAIDAIRPMRILLVDDNHDAADSTALLLQAHCHSVVVEYTSDAALRRSRSTPFDAIVLDIGMPDMDGRELCRQMKGVPHLSRTTFIALSGYGQATDLTLSQQAGFDQHFTKPVGIDDLLDALANSAVV
jgi:CheY-like chemotaxis protein